MRAQRPLPQTLPYAARLLHPLLPKFTTLPRIAIGGVNVPHSRCDARPLRMRPCSASSTTTQVLTTTITLAPYTPPTVPHVATRLTKAHRASLTAALVVKDTPEERLVVTASLDKSMALWKFTSDAQGSDEEIEVTRIDVPGAPVFSLTSIPHQTVDAPCKNKEAGVYCGTANKEVTAWWPLGAPEVCDKIKLDGHTGWVRSLATTGKWLFSCGCNCLRWWDTTFPVPKEMGSIKLFTGDILGITTAKGKVFTVGADGSIRSWKMSKVGELTESAHQDKAHDGRVSSCVCSASCIYTVSYDGSIKAWSYDTLELLAEVKGAHEGEKIYCVAVSQNGTIYTGGDDKMIRAWNPILQPVGEPLSGHTASVRSLSTGSGHTLVSGDCVGDLLIWTLPVLPSYLPAPDSELPQHLETLGDLKVPSEMFLL